MKQLRIPLIFALLTLNSAAQAQPLNAFREGNLVADKAISQMEQACEPLSGEMKTQRKPGFKQRFDLGKDQWIFIISGEKLACNHAYMCGTGGCQLRVISSTPQGADVIYDEQARGWKLLKAAHVLKLDVHGSHCGKPGNAECYEQLNLDTGVVK